MMKIVLVAALLGLTASLNCLVGKDGDKTLTSTACEGAVTNCYMPKFTSGTGYGPNAKKTGYGCGTCAARKAELAALGTPVEIDDTTDCDSSCTTKDCNAMIEVATDKCFAYTWSTDKWVKGAAAVCDKHLKKDFKCKMPLDLTGADAAQAKFTEGAGNGCGACGVGKTCAAACTKDSCNAYSEDKCFAYSWDEAKKTYVKGASAVCAKTMVADFKCNMPKDWTVKAKYAAGTGCGDCPVADGCPAVCTKNECNSARAIFAILPALLAALYTLF